MRQRRRVRPGDAANILVRAILSEASALLGGFTEEEWRRTLDFFEGRCAYTGEPLADGQVHQDHVVPMNMSSAGLHLFGNVLPVSRRANAEKRDRTLRDFVTDPTLLERIEKFVQQSGYSERASKFGDLSNYLRAQYTLVNGLVASARQYVEGLLPEGHVRSADPDRAPRVSASSTLKAREGVLPISLSPAGEHDFRAALLKAKYAWITTYYADGRVRTRRWNAGNFQATSSVIGNLRTRPEFRRGVWEEAGIARVAVSIERPGTGTE